MSQPAASLIAGATHPSRSCWLCCCWLAKRCGMDDAYGPALATVHGMWETDNGVHACGSGTTCSIWPLLGLQLQYVRCDIAGKSGMTSAFTCTSQPAAPSSVVVGVLTIDRWYIRVLNTYWYKDAIVWSVVSPCCMWETHVLLLLHMPLCKFLSAVCKRWTSYLYNL